MTLRVMTPVNRSISGNLIGEARRTLPFPLNPEALAGRVYWRSAQPASTFYDNRRRNMFEIHDDLIGLARMIFMPCMRYFYVMRDEIILVYAL